MGGSCKAQGAWGAAVRHRGQGEHFWQRVLYCGKGGVLGRRGRGGLPGHCGIGGVLPLKETLTAPFRLGTLSALPARSGPAPSTPLGTLITLSALWLWGCCTHSLLFFCIYKMLCVCCAAQGRIKQLLSRLGVSQRSHLNMSMGLPPTHAPGDVPVMGGQEQWVQRSRYHLALAVWGIEQPKAGGGVEGAAEACAGEEGDDKGWQGRAVETL